MMRHHRLCPQFHHSVTFHIQQQATGWMWRPWKLNFLQMIRWNGAFYSLMQLPIGLTSCGSWSETHLPSAFVSVICFGFAHDRVWTTTSTFTNFASANSWATRFENIWPWTAFGDMFCQVGVVFDLSLSLSLCFRRATGNLMSRVQDGTADQAANASQRKAAGWVSASHLIDNSMLKVQTICNQPNGLIVLWMLQVSSCNCGSDQHLTVVVLSAWLYPSRPWQMGKKIGWLIIDNHF